MLLVKKILQKTERASNTKLTMKHETRFVRSCTQFENKLNVLIDPVNGLVNRYISIASGSVHIATAQASPLYNFLSCNLDMF